MLESAWGQWAQLIYMVTGTMAALVILLPMVIRVSDALKNHLGRTAWNYLVMFVGVIFLAWTGLVAWMMVDERQRQREMDERVLPILEQMEQLMRERSPELEMARRKGTFWQREKGPLCRVVVATWPDGAERREATSRRVPINAFSSVERGPSGSVGRP